MDSWKSCCILNKFLVYYIFYVLITETVCENDICPKEQYVQKTRLVTQTYVETFQIPRWQCRSFNPARCIRRRNAHRVVQETYEELETTESCCAGYKEDPQTETLTCHPECDPSCLYGVCVAPNTCECEEGYSKLLGTENICQPDCSEPCVNGFCLTPEKCSCDEGYQLDTQNQYLCNPSCTSPCVNAYCSDPDVCTCNPGFRSTDEDPNKCQAHCSQPCQYGVCTSPEVCTCSSGYVMEAGSSSVCQPICSSECVNARCTAPNVCECSPGFEKTDDPSVCKPFCTSLCVNAYCSDPDVCTCNPGFRSINEDPNKCQAHCSQPCQNGVCTSPEVCTCSSGYKKDNNHTNICTPECDSGCKNGICTAPNVCTCFDGFINNNGYECEPDCPDGCHNSFCSTPGQCTCHPEYVMEAGSSSVCKPVCSSECVNARCTAPNVCECFPGFEKTDDPSVCKPFCSGGCDNGLCTKPGVCTCLWGYQADVNSPGCSIETEKHECSFINNMVVYDYKTCFQMSEDIKIEEMSNCKILQELLLKTKKSTSDIYLELMCDSVGNFTLNENDLDLKMVCDVVLKHLASNKFITERSTDQTNFISDKDLLPTITSLISSEMYTTSEESAISEEIYVASPTNYPQNITEIEDYPDEKFKITFNNTLNEQTSINSHNFPLILNTTLRFMQVITNKSITESYFDQNGSQLNQEWCLCNKNKTWNLCAKKPAVMYFCPCKAKNNESQSKGVLTSIMTLLEVAALSVLVVFLV